MKKKYLNFLRDPVWLKVMGITSALFFIYLSDAILSFWVPGFLEEVLHSGLAMGVVMSFSSVVGLAVDFLFPQAFPKAKVAVLYLGAVAVSLVFAISLWGALSWPRLLVLLVGMAVWGVYYELLLFANQQFVAETVSLEHRSRTWAILRTVSSLAYVLGPVIAGMLLGINPRVMLMIAMVLAGIGMLVLLVSSRKRPHVELNHELGEINVVAELEHWWVLIEHSWPILAMSLMLALIDSTFWSVGAVFSARMAQTNQLAGLWLSAYMVPSLFVGVILARWKIYKRKKRWAAKLMVVAGLLLSGLMVKMSLVWSLAIVFVASLSAALAGPLLDAVYTDLVARMGRERKHLIGLSSATSSVAYVVGPVTAGLIADLVGEIETFAVMGIATVMVGVVLLITMPKKLRLPQAEMEKWG